MIAVGNCHTPATVLEPPAGLNPVGSVIFLHGLGANRRTMMYLGADFAGHGFRTYLLDLNGHGDNQDAFTFAGAERCANAAVDLLTRNRQIDPARTILVGHSMGAVIAVRLSDRNPVAATIAISPAPLILPRRMPANLLVFRGGYDLWPMKREANDLAAAAGGERTRASDFAERRAFELQIVPHATHTSLLVDRGVAHRADLWAMQTLFPTRRVETLALNANLAPPTFSGSRGLLAGAFLGLFGLVLLFPALVTVAIVNPVQSEWEAPHPPYTLLILEQLVCALAAVMMLTLGVPLRFLHLYGGDYLASLLLLSDVMLLILNWKYVKANLTLDAKSFFGAAALGFAVFLAMGAWFTWQLGDLWMNAPRWLRFVGLVPLVCIFCLAEEVGLGPVGAGKRRALRFLVSMVMRLTLWLACVFAYYTLANGQALIGVLVTGLAIFSILQRLATDSLRLRTGSAPAAAVFGAILAAWFIAAVFPLA